MKKTSLLRKRPEFLLILLLGITPLLWFRPGSIIAKGDHFPYWLNPHETLEADVHLWNLDNMGGSNFMSATVPNGVLWLLMLAFGLSAEYIQILIHVFVFMVGGIAAYYLSKTVYPNLMLAPFITSIFYMFNFFVLQSRLNLGFLWTYAFLPLLILLLINVLEASMQQNTDKTNKNIIYFALMSTIAFSLSSANPADVIIILLALAAFLLYYIITRRNRIRQISISMTKLTALTVPLNIWWIIPTLNYYLSSSSSLTSQVSVVAWSWTHARASFLNLFWLNGQWSWRPEYVPYMDSYTNPILIILTFVPFILAATALLFRTGKSRFNAYLMLMVLIFVFLAKGVHEPLSQLNLLLYTYIPGMNMFREAATKFTLALMPFLALLVGYACHHITNRIANGNPKKHVPKKAAKRIVITFFLFAFVVSTYPLVTNPIETKTSQVPFSSYVKIPDYWNAATNWINNQEGDYRILVTPPNDFYMMPYTWGYFGADEWVTRFIQKPIITYYFGYTINNDTFNTIDYLYNTINDNKSSEFKAFLDLLNVKYILQRNDIQYNVTGRKIIPLNEMQAFLTQQPYIHLAQRFGQLDIYEYTEPKPYIYILNSTTLQQTAVKIENITTLERTWNFNFSTDIEEWQNTTPQNQFGANQSLTLDNGTLKAELWKSTWGWKTINSPILPAQYGDTYRIQVDVKGQNAYQVHIKIAECDENKNIITATYAAHVNDGTFDWTHINFNYELTNKTTKYIQIQVWHGHETDKPFPNIIWIDDVQIKGYTTILNTTGLGLIFLSTTQNQPSTILNHTKVNPTKITATVNATQPFTLAISEALDNQWTAYVNGQKIKPATLYLCITGFQISQTGMLDIVIEYEPQNWFYIGCAISITIFLACTAYLAYSYTKTKPILQKLKQKLAKTPNQNHNPTTQTRQNQNYKLPSENRLPITQNG